MDVNIGRRTFAIAIAALSLCFSSGSAVAQSSETSPEALIHRVVQNEVKAERNDNSHWMLRLETENKKGQREVDEVVQTKEGYLMRPILIDGRELSPQQRKQSDAQLGRNRDALRKSLQEQNQDNAKSQKMLNLIPNAFIFSYGERRGNLVQLLFKPNPKFHPNSHEEEVFHAMQGFVWVDEKQNRLAEISGKLMQEVKFGGGLLGHLDKGGTFDVKQQEVAPGFWELTVLNVDMKGKALFFHTIGAHQKVLRNDFKRVRDDLTVEQAADMLRKEPIEQKSAQVK